MLDPGLYKPLPDDWAVGVADVAQSTKAIRDNHYKAVNMAGAAVIVAVTNALGSRDFPFVFGGDGASFAVPAADAALARQALAATATWVKEELHLTLRVGLVPMATRARQRRRRARRPLCAHRIIFRSRHFPAAAWPGPDPRSSAANSPYRRRQAIMRPDLTGLSCRYEPIPAARGLILSLVMQPAPGRQPRSVPRGSRRYCPPCRRQPQGVAPVPAQGPGLKWPPQGYDFEARAGRRAGESIVLRRAKVLAWTSLYFLIMQTGIKVGGFVPQKYTEQVVKNSDFRKFDDALRMILDCSPELAGEIERRLSSAATEGTVLFGLHRQSAP